MAQTPKPIVFDGVDYQENGEFKTIYFDEPKTEREIWKLLKCRERRPEVKWAGQNIRGGKYLLFLREKVQFKDDCWH